MRRVCLYMGFVNDIRRKMLQLRADCCSSVSVSAVIFCNMNHLCILTLT